MEQGQQTLFRPRRGPSINSLAVSLPQVHTQDDGPLYAFLVSAYSRPPLTRTCSESFSSHRISFADAPLRPYSRIAVTPDSWPPRYARCNYTVCFFRKGMFDGPIVTIQATRDDQIQIRKDNY